MMDSLDTEINAYLDQAELDQKIFMRSMERMKNIGNGLNSNTMFANGWKKYGSKWSEREYELRILRERKGKKAMELEKELKTLEEFADVEGTEVGEMWNLLVSIWSRRDYISDQLANALKKEIITSYKYIKKNAVIKEEPVTRIVKSVEFKR